MDLVYPRCAKVDTLEYWWEGYSVVILFSSDDDLATVKEWYWKRPLNSKVVDDSEHGETAQCHYFVDGSRQTLLAEICLAGSAAFGDLASYIGSQSLDEMIRNEPRTIGALFVRRNEPNNPTMQLQAPAR